MTQHGETRIYVLKNGCWQDYERMRILDPNLTSCQLAIQAENTVKIELSTKNGRGNQTKMRGGSGVGDALKMNEGNVNKNLIQT